MSCKNATSEDAYFEESLWSLQIFTCIRNTHTRHYYWRQWLSIYHYHVILDDFRIKTTGVEHFGGKNCIGIKNLHDQKASKTYLFSQEKTHQWRRHCRNCWKHQQNKSGNVRVVSHNDSGYYDTEIKQTTLLRSKTTAQILRRKTIK